MRNKQSGSSGRKIHRAKGRNSAAGGSRGGLEAGVGSGGDKSGGSSGDEGGGESEPDGKRSQLIFLYSYIHALNASNRGAGLQVETEL